MLCQREETERNSRFLEENLLPTKLGSQTQSEVKFPLFLKQARVTPTPPLSGLINLSFLNRKPRVSLISGLTNSEFSLNLLSGTGLRSPVKLLHNPGH